MNRHWKAFFLSLTLLPGAGHYYLGQKKLGSLIMATSTLILIAILVVYCKEFAQAINQANLSRPIVTEVFTAMKSAWKSQSSFYVLGLLATVFLWVGSALHVLKNKSKT